jgi:2-haloacid dehalogenase|tara:strand:+ start:1526 stop:2143 length:618 start_codon:yes stop_codon:yes gene_type:complete
MNSKIDTIIFDLGGVLVDWNPKYLYEKIFDSQEEVEWFLNNVCTSDWNIEQDAGRTIEEANALKIAEFPDYEKFINMFYERWDEMFSGPIQESVKIQQKLIADKNYKVYALTNWSAEKWELGKQLFPFFNDFEGVVVSGQENTRKPFDDIYQLILKRYSIIPENSVFIDDNFENTLGSSRNGIHSIHFKSPEQLKSDLKKLNVIT